MRASFSQLPIRVKIPTSVIGAVVTVAAATGALAIYVSTATLSHEVSTKLSSVASEKAAGMERYLTSLDQDIATVATNSQTLDALQAFAAGWKELGSKQEEKLKQAYIEDNPHSIGEKEKLDVAPEANSYNVAHGRFHPWFRQFLYARGYYDIFLFNRDGDLVYSVFKELDYATNLLNGEYKNTGLGQAFRAGLDADVGDISFFDFAPYAPSHGAPASFMSTPIPDEQGNRAGVLVFQMPIDQLNASAGNAKGLGETGDSFLVGDDFLLRTDAGQTEESDILSARFENEAVRTALSGEQGQRNVEYAGKTKIVGFAPIEFHGSRYAMIALQERDEALAAVGSMMQQFALAALALIALFGGVGMFIARSITMPMNAVVEDMNAVAEGDLDRDISGSGRADEVGQIAKALDIFKANALERFKLEEQERARAAKLDDLIGEFDREAHASMSGFAQANESLEDIANDIKDAVGESNLSVQTVAAAAEELSVSIQEISRSTTNSREIASKSVEQVESASEVVNELVASLGQIVGIIDLISEIAEQTNLLALNATIESARAGEMGRGFAVVASEVKALASRTTQATSDITSKIDEIQNGAQQATASMGCIREIVSQIDEFALTIASAVEEQHATTGDIATSAQTAARQAEIVHRRIGGEQAQTTAGDQTVHAATAQLNGAATNLSGNIERFLEGVRAA